jgi:hypothetical protein
MKDLTRILNISRQILTRHMRKHDVGKVDECNFSGCKYLKNQTVNITTDVEAGGENSKGRVRKFNKKRVSGGSDDTSRIIPWELSKVLEESAVIQKLGAIINYLENENENLKNAVVEKYLPTVIRRDDESASIGVCVCPRCSYNDMGHNLVCVCPRCSKRRDDESSTIGVCGCPRCSYDEMGHNTACAVFWPCPPSPHTHDDVK